MQAFHFTPGFIFVNSPPMEETAYFHVARVAENMGTYTEQEIADFFRSGHFLADDLVWRSGMSDWLPLTEVFPHLAGSKSPPPLPAAWPTQAPATTTSTAPARQPAATATAAPAFQAQRTPGPYMIQTGLKPEAVEAQINPPTLLRRFFKGAQRIAAVFLIVLAGIAAKALVKALMKDSSRPAGYNSYSPSGYPSYK